MPELPEVETIRRGLEASILNQKIAAVIIRNFSLRHPIPKHLPQVLQGQKFQQISRRGKYLLLKTKIGTLIIHLGMSGKLQIKNSQHRPLKHEHVQILFANNLILCYHDPRRFGAMLWTTSSPLEHPSLKNLGPEPLEKSFTATYLFKLAQTRKCPIKQLLMNNLVVTGIGNIYANEALFAAKINPLQKANTIPLPHYQTLVKNIKRILKLAIKYGGTTISDYTDSRGKQGLFQNKLKVYARATLPCYNCQTKLVTTRVGQRSTVFCPHCQPTLNTT